MRGGPQPGNHTSAGNPMIRSDQRYMQDQYSKMNQESIRNDPVRNHYAKGGGGIAPGNQSSLGNPLVLPDAYARNSQAEAYNREYAKANSITAKPVGGGGFRPTNDASYGNPLAPRGDYQRFAQENQEYVKSHPIRGPAMGGGGGGGGGIRPGNDSSYDNPLNNYNPKDLQSYADRNRELANNSPLKAGGKAVAMGGGGGIKPGNLTSADNPMNTRNYEAYGKNNYYYDGDNDPNADRKMNNLAYDAEASPQKKGGYMDNYEHLTPKQRLEMKKREHYMQGSISSNVPNKGPAGGGLSHSNETSLGNPLMTHNPQMLDYYKQVNKNMVAEDPIKKGGRGGGYSKQAMGGGGGAPYGGGASYGGGGGGAGGNQGGGNDDGVVRKRGGVAMNL